jgi:hypothetical protein
VAAWLTSGQMRGEGSDKLLRCLSYRCVARVEKTVGRGMRWHTGVVDTAVVAIGTCAG